MLTKLAYCTRFPLQRQEISAKENYFSYLLALITAWAHRKPHKIFFAKEKIFCKEKFFNNYLEALITACAPARRAAGTRNGEQET